MDISNALKLVESASVSEKKILTLIFDAAHGEETPGKRSPDGKFREYRWSRIMIEKILPGCAELGYVCYETNTTEKEIGLSRRKSIADAFNGNYKVLLSIHNNAAGNGSKWMNATGISFYTCKGQTMSDVFAECLYASFKNEFPEEKFRTDARDGDSDIEENFTVLMGNTYKAVLAEILFQDNRSDVAKLEDEEWQSRCVDAFIAGIEKYNFIIQNL